MTRARRGAAKYLDAKAARYPTGKRPALPDREAFRIMREGLIEHLLDYAAGEIDAVHKELAFDAADALRDLDAGHAPELLKVCRGRGSTRLSHAAKGAIEDAVRYIKWAKDGYLRDPAPLKTIEKLFKVRETTVRKWVRESTVVLAAECPSREEIKFAIATMRFSARHYPTLPGASSHAAIRERKAPASK